MYLSAPHRLCGKTFRFSQLAGQELLKRFYSSEQQLLNPYLWRNGTKDQQHFIYPKPVDFR